MSEQFRIRRGLDIPLAGAPAQATGNTRIREFALPHEFPAEVIADNIHVEDLDVLSGFTQPVRGELGVEAAPAVRDAAEPVRRRADGDCDSPLLTRVSPAALLAASYGEAFGAVQ